MPLDTGCQGCRSCASRSVRHAPHLRIVGDCGRPADARDRGDDGDELEQLSKTYAHLLPDSADRARVALDAFLAESDATFVDFVGTDG